MGESQLDLNGLLEQPDVWAALWQPIRTQYASNQKHRPLQPLHHEGDEQNLKLLQLLCPQQYARCHCGNTHAVTAPPVTRSAKTHSKSYL